AAAVIGRVEEELLVRVEGKTVHGGLEVLLRRCLCVPGGVDRIARHALGRGADLGSWPVRTGSETRLRVVRATGADARTDAVRACPARVAVVVAAVAGACGAGPARAITARLTGIGAARALEGQATDAAGAVAGLRRLEAARAVILQLMH